MIGIILVCFFGYGYTIPVNLYPMLTPDSLPAGAICKGGYYWDYIEGGQGQDGCCSYHQCDDTAIRYGHLGFGKAFRRWCMEPLVWDKDAYACVQPMNSPEPACRDPPPGCWGNPLDHPQAECEATEPEQCCQVGQVNGSTSGQPGLLFTKVNETHYIFCKDRWPQPCPFGKNFDLETCCCENVTCESAMYSWDFESPSPWEAKKDESSIETDGAYFRHDECNIEGSNDEAYAQCVDGFSLKLDLFVNIFLDQDYYILGQFNTDGGTFTGDLFSNGEPTREDACKIKVSYDGNNVEYTVCEEQGSIPLPGSTGDFVVVIFGDPTTGETYIYVDSQPLVTIPYQVIRGTICPLEVGGFGGQVQHFLLVPSIQFFNELFALGKVEKGPLISIVDNLP